MDVEGAILFHGGGCPRTTSSCSGSGSSLRRTTEPSDGQDVYASPLRATNERLKGLAPAPIQTAEMDVLRDEGEAYARKLDQAGVDIIATRYNGLIHDYGLLNAISHVPAVHSALLQASKELKKWLR
jgi:acetyl esterase